MAPLPAPRGLREVWIAEQERIAKLCVAEDELDWSVHGQFIEGLKYVAGVDVSFFPDGVHAVAAVVVISYPDMEVVYENCANFKLKVPYMSGFLAFREVPALKAMLEKVPSLPTVGVAKDVLRVGDIDVSTARKVSKTLEGASDWAPLVGNEGETEPLAALLRPSFGKKELVVSAGHRVSLSTAIVLVASLCKASIPEPIRQADLRSRAAVRAWFAGKSLSKLKMPQEEGAGDLLRISWPESCDPGNMTSDNLIHHDSNSVGLSVAGPGTGSRTKSTTRQGKAGKAKLVWRVKSVANDSQDSKDARSEETREREGKPTVSPYATDSTSMSLWMFLKASLFGLCCVARYQ